jgi:hypothetical protein
MSLQSALKQQTVQASKQGNLKEETCEAVMVTQTTSPELPPRGVNALKHISPQIRFVGYLIHTCCTKLWSGCL